MPQLLIRHLMLFLFLCVLPAAVAALTRNMAQFWLVAVVSAFVLAVGARALSEFASDWAGGRLNWIWSYASFGTLVMVAAVVVYVQYRKRQHRAAQWLAAAGLTSAIVLPALIPWSTARAIQQSLSPADGLRLSIHVAGPRQPYKESQVRSDFVRLRVPVRVEGLGDRDLLSDRLTVRIGSWESGGRSKMWLGRQDLETFVQAFELPVEVYRRHQHEPVRLVSEAFVSTYVKAGDATVPFGAEVDVPGVGVCASREQQADVADKNEVVVACRLPPSGGERVLLRVEKQGGPLEFWGTLTTGALSPSATSLSIAPVELRRWSITGPRTDPTGLLFRRMRLEASFPVTWTFEQFKLADYVTWEPDQGRR